VTKTKLPQSAQIAIAVAVLIVILIAGYFIAVKPQKGKAADLATEITARDGQISDARALLAKAKNAQKVKVADLFRLTKAMPDQPDEAGIVLELTSVARASGIAFESITPQGSTIVGSYQVVPITVIFEGNFFQLNDFLFRLRNLVDVRSGALAANGRLFTVDTIQFDEGELLFPQIRASVQLDAYIYGTGATVSAPPQTSTPAATGATTTGTSTTPTATAPSTTTTSPTTTTTTPSPTTTSPATGASSPTGASN
jgi:type IV pilus assembly protein PilO